MSLDPFKRGPIERTDILHLAIGSAICFGLTILLLNLVFNQLPYILYNLGVAGVIFFKDNYIIARALFTFGTVYLTTGFCAGVYAGYNLYANLKLLLFIPAIISTVGYILLILLLGDYSLITSEFVGLSILQFVGNSLGSFLGGYAINWNYLKTETNRRTEKIN